MTELMARVIIVCLAPAAMYDAGPGNSTGLNHAPSPRRPSSPDALSPAVRTSPLHVSTTEWLKPAASWHT
eukprot:CAMPEP_0198714314 /NCGR_PEP_ID=MMETSP1471-20131121/19408_1 /TAXON_ID=41880 /ORGANISM="Pycnococcus provasolii, Strain RCC733" /LENGTH=69 /DNA_ID=CAMNT_0044474593 /DNA_START=158 /DNA_END=367 /DNA_ORIENTATION=-